MAEMKDMAYTQSEIKERNKSYGVESADATTTTYSWGLNIRLEQAELDKLGIDELPEVGSEIYLDVCAKVRRVTNTEDENDQQATVELQITKMGIESGNDKDEENESPSPRRAVSNVMSYNRG
jgi:hypothetical protein